MRKNKWNSAVTFALWLALVLAMVVIAVILGWRHEKHAYAAASQTKD